MVYPRQIPDRDKGLDEHSEHVAVLRLQFDGCAEGLRVTSSSTTPFAGRVRELSAPDPTGGEGLRAGWGGVRDPVGLPSRVPAAVIPGSETRDTLDIFITVNFLETVIGYPRRPATGELTGALAAAATRPRCCLLAGRPRFRPLRVGAVRWLRGGAAECSRTEYCCAICRVVPSATAAQGWTGCGTTGL